MTPKNLEEVRFEERDLSIFSIPEIKTRLDTLQNYFFPRLEFLLRFTLERVEEIYGVDPYERMTVVYRPRHRKGSKRNVDFGEVFIGISGKRSNNRSLRIVHENGEPYSFHPSYLTYTVDSLGLLYVSFRPFVYKIDHVFRRTFSKHVMECLDVLEPLLSQYYITYGGAVDFQSLKTYLEREVFVFFESAPLFIPVDTKHGLLRLVGAFVMLFPLLDSLVSIGRGETPRLSEMLELFKKWCLRPRELGRKKETLSCAEEFRGLPELESYSFIRAGLWWDVLSRDKWTCCSCGRSAKDGITLHVDHIVPRSLGGVDTIDNLQTLCRKCNIGKSNRDDTDLRN